MLEIDVVDLIFGILFTYGVELAPAYIVRHKFVKELLKKRYAISLTILTSFVIGNNFT